ncbi:serine hydrolase family protein [Streptomyces sp. SID5785]|uniref:RBBP9/YdeN family alpha/beta hydrolase n=1 Tax=Streptomyces sp. SID5785 TaxID=2690309 RepID=UPI0013611A41|nr:alpha/beta hydrolase [Streptomyces sp. SID5785]MZD09988.1 serine hydrolase family protein [Streptomyces sp. SID5785]
MTRTTTQQRATIIHGYGATPEDHWFGWLAAQLEARGIPTSVPALPDSEAPDPDRWSTAVASDIGTPDEGTILVAHSLGCLTVLRHLSSLDGPWRLGALVLVSGFVDVLPSLPELDAHIGFVAARLGLAGVAAHVDRLTVIRSDADRYVPPRHTDRLADLLGTRAQVVAGGGHFLASDGFVTLQAALEAAVRDAPAPPGAGSAVPGSRPARLQPAALRSRSIHQVPGAAAEGLPKVCTRHRS